MHVHATQVNPYAAADALRSAQRAEAKREAERVSQELMESASELASESEINDDFVVRTEEHEQSQQQGKKRKQQKEPNQTKHEPTASTELPESHLSDWA